MRINVQRYRDELSRIPGNPPLEFSHKHAGLTQWLLDNCIPEDISAFLLQNTPASLVSFDGLGGIFSPDDIIYHNNGTPQFKSDQLIQIGSAINGDPIVIDYGISIGITGYVDHETLWSGDMISARQIFIPVANTIDDYLHALLTDDEFPIDYYMAVDSKYNITRNT